MFSAQTRLARTELESLKSHFKVNLNHVKVKGVVERLRAKEYPLPGIQIQKKAEKLKRLAAIIVQA